MGETKDKLMAGNFLELLEDIFSQIQEIYPEKK